MVDPEKRIAIEYAHEVRIEDLDWNFNCRHKKTNIKHKKEVLNVLPEMWNRK